jgi:hypothetical protein
MEGWLLGVGAVLVAAQFTSVFVRLKSDIPRIKRDYEVNGSRVSRVSPAGFDAGLFRRGHYYRKYRIVVDHPMIGRTTHLVGVSASWFSDQLKRYD